MSVPAGQVLVYRGHRPRGLFLLLEGRVVCAAVPHRGPLLVPRLADLDRTADATVTTGEASTLLYIARSVLLCTPPLVSLLETAGLDALPLS